MRPRSQPEQVTGAAEAVARLPFPIVAVGASAGGLAPTVELLGELAARPGIGIVIIHHLDPAQKSGLVEILARASAMPVAAATEGARVEPNRVYVVPPNTALLIDDGVLSVVPRADKGGPHLPIDRFCESLALDRHGLAVAVVLSGGGYDGNEEIRAIQREGGITLAQDATASFGSMPESAVATGCVDFILPPAGLARELTRIGAQAPLFSTPQRAAEDHDYAQVLAAMGRASGVDFTSYKHPTIRRRLRRRLIVHGLTDVASYLGLLERDAAEIGLLCEEVLIHVTRFFREPEVFEALRARVFPKLVGGRPRDVPIRAWVPGCSSGEEVYTLAIALLEVLGDTRENQSIKLFGTDLSLVSIDKAHRARYADSIEADVSSGRLQRFFTRDEGGYRVRRDVRDLCVFAKHDVTRDPPFSAMDLVSCRDLMIYLCPDLQDRAVALLHYALKEPGFLVLSRAETVRAFAGFAAVDRANKIYERTSAAPRLAFDFTTRASSDLTASGAGAAVAANAAAVDRPPGPSDVQREADRLVLAAYAPPGVVVTNDLAIVQFRGQTGAFLEPAPGTASFDLLRMAREELKLPLCRVIDRARSSERPARETGLTLLAGEKRRAVTLAVIPFAARAMKERFFLVLFEDVSEADAPTRGATTEAPPEPVERGAEESLRHELASTRQYLESVIDQLEATNEELKAANEEVVSSNEELRSTNEELQSAKEELQATNEELRTLNDEMGDRNLEATRLSDDLLNVFASAEIAILIVGRDLRLRRFTPAAGRVFGLVATDLGRAVNDVSRIIAVAPAMPGLMQDALDQLRHAECTIQDHAARRQLLTVRPYVTLDGRIDGTVVIARDIDAETKAAETLAVARRYAESIVETVREGLVVLDRHLRTRSANAAFYRLFGLTPKDVEGRRLDELERPGDPALQTILSGLGDGASAWPLRIERDTERGGPRVLLVDVRYVEGGELTLVSVADVTEAERSRFLHADQGIREALNSAVEGALMMDHSRQILFANLAAARLFGYESDELLGLSVDRLLTDCRETNASRARDAIARRRDGTEFPVEISIGTLVREGGVATIAFVTDVSERRRAEQALHGYQDQLQRMAFDAVVTEEEERRRIATELHDSIGQDLALARIKLAPLARELVDEPRAVVQGVAELIAKALEDSRSLVFELSPPVLYDLGLVEAVAWLADDVEKRHSLAVEVSDDGSEKPLDDAAKAVVFRGVRELLMNVLKHAEMPAATVRLWRSDEELHVEVSDAGVGFDPTAPADRSSPGRFGLFSVREQIARLGGNLQIHSAPQRGTVVSLRVPLKTSDLHPRISDRAPPGGPAS
jgi:two-component system CheB/CheR fusion protein